MMVDHQQRTWLVVGSKITGYERAVRTKLDEHVKRKGKPEKVFLIMENKENSFNEVVSDWCRWRKIEIVEVKPSYDEYGRKAGVILVRSLMKKLKLNNKAELIVFTDLKTSYALKKLIMAMDVGLRNTAYSLPHMTKKGKEKSPLREKMKIQKVNMITTTKGTHVHIEEDFGITNKFYIKNDGKLSYDSYILQLALLKNRMDLVTDALANGSVDVSKLSKCDDEAELSHMVKVKIRKSRRYHRVSLTSLQQANISIKWVLDKNNTLHNDVVFYLEIAKDRNDLIHLANVARYMLKSLHTNKLEPYKPINYYKGIDIFSMV